MNNRKLKMWQKPLALRRDGKKLLLNFVHQFVYPWAGEVKIEEINEWHLNDFDCRIRKPRCKRCWDTGHVGTGIAPPLTGIECMECDLSAKLMTEFKRVKGLEDRIRILEGMLADAAIAKTP